ncbi:two-partner secretion domain-containing protein [Mucisphaera calidilacus]|uniref:Heme/hemopexin-binding protein n=1 Tax=Mucisphaera calidilacus TaxID=2527982 RepID=A0A518BVE6_9BACT|nr:filamentous hemagglutinin N-terminal domain-containing protein [Mucisphaera calidilacus]QDU70914.1 Heme/hemopexin-binding protein precursor [Mucisphaera calidilacus]
MTKTENAHRRSRVLSFPSWRLLAALPLAAAGLGSPARADIEGANVVHGTADISQIGNVTNITTSQTAIIEYSKFNINQNETFNFIQPDASSRVYNHVKSINASMINGSLNANGHVYIINPSGIYFGNGAIVNVGNLYAAAGNLAHSDFIDGIDRFTNISGEVVNHGTIRADVAALIGQRVANHGSILTDQNLIMMATDDEVILMPRDGHIMVKFARDQTPDKLDGDPTLVNTGTLDGGEGQVMLASTDVFGLALYDTSTVRGGDLKIAAEQGRGEISGTVTASNKAEITAKNVVVKDADVSAGDTLHVGGGYQGGSDLANSETTFVSDNSVLSVGDGGELVVWSDGATGFYGSLYATNASVEISGKEFLAFDPNVMGLVGGHILFDPRNVTIDAVGPTTDPFDAAGNLIAATDDSVILVDDIVDILLGTFAGPPAIAAPTDVTITTGATGAQPGNVSLDADLIVAMTSTQTLTINAAGNIDINNVITNTDVGANALNVDLIAGGTVTVAAAITTNNGTFSSSGTTFDNTALINTGSATTTINHTDAVTLAAITAGALDVDAGGAIIDNGTLTITNNASFTETASAGITLDEAASAFGTLTFNSGGDVDITEAGGTVLTGTLTADNLTFTATGGDLTDADGTTLTVTTLADLTGANITVGNNAGDTTNFGTLTVNSAGNVAVTEDSATQFAGTSSVTGTLTVNSDGDITQAAASTVTVGGLTTLVDAAGGTDGITLDLLNDFADIAASSDGDISINDINGLILSDTSADNLTVVAAGDLTDADGTTLTVTTLADLTGANITVGNNAGDTTNFGTLTVNSAGNVAVTEDSATQFAGTSSVTGTLTVNSDGDITQAAASTVTVGGLTTLVDATGGTDGITLDLLNDFATIAASSDGDISINDINGLILSDTSADNLTVVAAGDLTDADGTTLTVTTLADLTGANITVGNNAGDTTNFGTLTVNSAGNVAVTEDSATQFAGTSSVTGTLTVNSDGDITQAAASTVTVGGLTTLVDATGGTDGITLDLLNDFATIAASSDGDISINDINGLILSDTSADNLTVVAAGDLTDADGTTLTVTTLADLTGANITVGNNAGDTTNFGTLTVNSAGNVAVTEDSATQFAGTSSVTGTLTVNSDGDITQAAASTVTVGGLTTLVDATGGTDGITLDLLNDFATIAASSDGDISINDINGLILSDTSADNLTVVAAGDLTDADGTTLTVTTLADLTGANITVGNNAGDTTNFGTLTVNSAGNVAVTEDSATQFDGLSVVGGDLTMTSLGAITQDAAPDAIQVTGTATFIDEVGGGDGITLANPGNSFGVLALTTPGDIDIAVTGDLAIGDTSVANLTLTVNAGSLTDADGTTLTVTNLADLTADNITLGDNAGDTTNFGTLTVNSGGNVAVTEDSATQFAGTSNVTGTLTVNSDGDITQAGGSTVTVGGLTTLVDATGGTDGITLDLLNDFATIAASSDGDISINDINGLILSDTSADNLTVVATGDLTDANGSTIAVTTLADLTGANITVGDNAGDTTNFGTLTVNSAGNVDVTEDSATQFAGANAVTGTLTVNSDGDITQAGGSTVTVGGLTTLVDAAGGTDGITLDLLNDFATIAASSDGDISINDINGLILSDISADNLTVVAAGDLTDADGTALAVTTLADLTGANITVGDNAGDTTNFGTLTVNSAGNVAVTEDSATQFAGTSNVTGTLTVNSDGDITQAGGSTITVGGLTTLVDAAGGTDGITLDLLNDFADIAATSDGAVVINDINAIDLGAITADSLDVDAAGAISDSDTLTITNNADFNDSTAAGITLDEAASTFGTLTFNSTGDVAITEADDTVLTGANTADNFTMDTTGAITDENGTTLDINSQATFNSTSAITLGDDASEVHRFGSLQFVSTPASIIQITEEDDMDVVAGSTASSLTLTSRTGGITTPALNISQNLILTAANGITLNGNLTAGALASLNADSDAASTPGGDLTLVAGVRIDTSATNAQILIGANDLIMDPTARIDSGAGLIRITESHGGGIGLGDAVIAGGMTISGTELESITSGTLQLDTNGLILVDNVTAANSNNIGGTLIMISRQTGSEGIAFEGTESFFNTLDVQADDRIRVDVNVTTDTGAMAMDGDFNNLANTNDDIVFADGVMLTAAGDLTLDATSGGLNGLGTLDLVSGGLLTINDTLTTLDTLDMTADNGLTINADITTNGITTLDADNDNDGTGTLTVGTNATVNSSGNDMNVIAGDLDFTTPAGTQNYFALSAGAGGDISILASNDKQITVVDLTPSFAQGANEMWISAGDNGFSGSALRGELERIQARNLTLTTTGAGDIVINTEVPLPVGPGSIDRATAYWQSASPAGGILTFTAGDAFTMTYRERFTMDNGSIQINTGGDVRIADLTATSSIGVASGGSITLIQRAQENVTTPDGLVVIDEGADMVVGQNIIMTGTSLGVDASFSPIRYILSSSTDAATITFNGNPTSIIPGQSSDVIIGTLPGGFIGDGAASGSSSNVSSAIAAATPRIENAEIVEEMQISQAMSERLTELNIFARDHSFAEVLEWLVGQRLYDDLPRSAMPDPNAVRRVAVGRLNASLVSAVINDFEDLVYRTATDQAGQPMFDPDTGEAMRVKVDNEIRERFASAYDAYTDYSGGTFDAMAFRAYVQENDLAAWANLEAIGGIIESMELLALPPVESATAIESLIRDLAPENMELEQLLEAARPTEKLAMIDQ